MEKIQTSTAVALDRMAVLQQRYRQHKETMNSDNSSDKSRRTSTTSTIDSTVSHRIPVFLLFSSPPTPGRPLDVQNFLCFLPLESRFH
jgi:hypothetical protein